MHQFFIMEGEQQKGPYTAPELQVLRKNGRLAGSTMVWREGLDEWKPLDEILPIARPQTQVGPKLKPPKPPSNPRGVLLLFGYITAVGIFGFFSWRGLHFWGFLVSLVVFAILCPIGYMLGAAFRRFTMPTMIFARGAWNLFEKKIILLIGPQLFGIGIAAIVAYVTGMKVGGETQPESKLVAREHIDSSETKKDETARQPAASAKERTDMEREREAPAENARMEAERRKNEAEREEQQRLTMQRNAELAKQAEAARKQEQEQLAAQAITLFSKVSLSPPALLSSSLKRLNITVELRGKEAGKASAIQSLLQKRDYLKVIGTLLDQPYAEYPPVAEIKRAHERLWELDLKIFAKTKIMEGGGGRLYLVWFPKTDREGVMQFSTDWERHPDGTGYLHKWIGSQEPAIVVSGNNETVAKPIYAASETSREQIGYLVKKKELGEIDEATYTARLAEIRKVNHDLMLKWALSR